MQLLEEVNGTVRTFVTKPTKYDHDWDPELPAATRLFRQDEVVVAIPRDRVADIDPDTHQALRFTARGVSGKDPDLLFAGDVAFLRFSLPSNLELGNPVHSLTENVRRNLQPLGIPYLLVFGGVE